MSANTQRSVELMKASRDAGSAISKLTAQGDYIGALALIKKYRITELQMVMLYGGFSVIACRPKAEFMLHCQRELKTAADARLGGHALHAQRHREHDDNRLKN
jgi:hypothetical protein